jgi:diguanylate cyclase
MTRLAGILLVTSWLAFVIVVLATPPRQEYDAWRNLVLFNLPFVFAAAICLFGTAAERSYRRTWRALGIGLISYIAGDCYSTVVIGTSDVYPSPADALWLSFYLMAYVAIVAAVRERMTEFRLSAWLDGLIGGFGAAAVVVAFALGPVLSETSGKLSVVATNLAYPVADVLLVVFIVSAATALNFRSPTWWLLSLGLVVFAVGDVIFLFQTSMGDYMEGGLLDITWPSGAVLLGLAARSAPVQVVPMVESGQRYVVAWVFAAGSVVVLTVGQYTKMPTVAVILAVTAIAVASVRMFLTLREATVLAESRREARTDELTGLANRRAFTELLESELAAGTMSAVMIMDLDSFKEVNDSLGHDAGDDLLRWVSTRLIDVFPLGRLARLGGDEFGVMIPIEHRDEAVVMARRAIAALQTPLQLGSTSVRVGASIGIALSPTHGRRRSELVRFADVAMYEAKRTRGSVVVFDPDRDPDSLDQLSRTNQLADAIVRREMELHYQPAIDVTTGRARGIEALVRWRQPDGTLLFPDSFVPLAERAGLIRQITRNTLHEAVSFHGRLSRTNPGLSLSVNVSGHDLGDDELPMFVYGLLERHSMPPSLLTLEITETALVADLARAHHSIGMLRDVGIRISVDDFGVGYSSMAQLIGFQVDELKIDKTFVTNLDSDSRMRAVVRSLIELGHALDLKVVAEGVESERTWQILDELGCDVAQGFHLSRPLLPTEVADFVRRHRHPAVVSGHVG